MPSADNFELVTVSVPARGRAKVQVQNLWMTVDPYMRGRMAIVRFTRRRPGRARGARRRDRGDRRVQLDHVRLAPELPTR